jgi:hypothetical protein
MVNWNGKLDVRLLILDALERSIQFPMLFDVFM